MFALSTDTAYTGFTVRPVNKVTDRPVIREIFRREFYGNHYPAYPDEGLWEIYDRMETTGPFGAYLVSRNDQVLFLLEIHPPIQMDLNAGWLSDPDAVGIYCFLYGREDAACLNAFRACISSLLESGVSCILTTRSRIASPDPKTRLLERSGFQRLPGQSGHLAVYGCTRDNFDAVNLLSTGILFATLPSFTE